MFYEEYVPKILQNYQHGNVPKDTRAFYLFSEPEPLIKTVSISHIAMIGDDRILICINGLQTKIYNHTPPRARPFKSDNWEELVQLEELNGKKITCSMIGKDYFIVGVEEWDFYMFDLIGYKLLDKGFVRYHPVLCMLSVKDNLVAFGHLHGIITLWETSKRYLTVEELEKMRYSIIDNEKKQLDKTAMERHRIHPDSFVKAMP